MDDQTVTEPAVALAVPAPVTTAPVLLAIVLALVTPSGTSAQTCWRARPAPRCSFFWITESGPRFGNHEAFVEGHLGSATAVGLMTNRSASIAFGATLELTTGSESGTYRLAVMPRFRRWLTPAIALDLAGGVALLGEGERAAGFKGVSGLVAVSVADFVVVAAEVEMRHGLSIGTQTAATIGVRFGSYLGPPVAVASLVLGVLAGGGLN